ncbi:MAG TPA: BTAD domain-containing putative transcriptional regulator [Gemmatimonadales bacterium]|nr:BTAD domain-containing putative transcriptional regulator [Gemmatimonadales bacterium]
MAAAGARGMSRERLLGILWPDSDQERARHSLSQTIYSLRRDLGGDPVVGGTDLKLDPRVASSDVGDFHSALAAGDPSRALDLYTGPFLEGFFLAEAPEFERWQEDERTRLAKAVTVAAEAVVKETAKTGDPSRAEVAWRRLASLDPLSGRIALGYMTSLAAIGDRARALAFAREHEGLVRRDLDAPPDPEVTRFAEKLRRELRSAPPAPTSAAEPASVEPASVAARKPLEPLAQPELLHVVASRRRWLWFAAAAVLIGIAATYLTIRVSNHPASLPLLAVGRIHDAIVRDTADQSGVLTDMLATSFGRVRGLQVVANSRLFELMRPGSDTARGAFLEAARRAQASQILEGELSYAPGGGLQLELRRIDLRTGVVRQGYRVRALDRFALVDSATAAIAGDFALPLPAGTFAELSTSSPLAYRLYEEGLRSYYQYDGAGAYRLMLEALKEDSNFASAAYYAWLSGSREVAGPPAKYLQLAVRLAPRAPDRERLWILGTAGSAWEDPAAVFFAESLAIRFPADPNGQFLLGGIKSQLGDYAGAVIALNRAVAIDSTAGFMGAETCRACEGLSRLSQVYIAWDSLPASERTGRRWIRLQPRSPVPHMNLIDALERQERWNEVDAELRTADSLEPGRHNFRTQRLYHLVRRGDYDGVAREAAAALYDPSQVARLDARWLWVIALRNQGRLREATELLRQRSFPVDDSLLQAKATVDFESGRWAAAIADYAALVAANQRSDLPGHRARGVSWNLTLEGTVRAAAGDTGMVRRIADSVEVIGRRSLFGRSSRLHHFLRGLLLAKQGRHAEAVDAYQRAIISWSEGFTRINFELARSLLALGRNAEAIAALQPALRGAIDASNLYLTRTELHELLAQAFAAAGSRDSAAAHYRAVVRAWERADSQFESRRQAARDWLARAAR